MNQPTPEVVRALWAHMTAHYGSVTKDKGTAEEMTLIAKALSLMGILDQEAFLHSFTTTIENTIYTPFTPGVSTKEYPLWDQIVICVHEHQHIVQAKQGLLFPLRYLTDPVWRALYEGGAYRVTLTLEFWHTGKVPELEPYVKALRNYGVNTGVETFFQLYLQTSAATIRAGGVPDEAAQVALDWLGKHAPMLKG